MSNEPVAPPYNWSGDDYRGRYSGDDYRGRYSGDDYRGRNSGDDYRRRNSGDRNSYDGHDIEGYGRKAIGFDNASIRAGFVRKVFFIVTIMLLVVIIMVTPAVVDTELRMMVIEYRWIALIAAVVYLVTFCGLVCCRSLARCFPLNLMLLAIFTIASGIILAVICALSSPQSVLLALITATICCGAIILFASQTSCDVTGYFFLIYAGSAAVFTFGAGLAILQLFVYIKLLHVIFSAVVCVTFMVYLALDIQMIIGGRRYEISPEEYIFAALMLFVDIIEIFSTLQELFEAAE
ncbi:hypothetical protein V3C99_013568 [Haemonchus contortus]